MLSMFKDAAEPAAAGSVTSTYNATVVRPASVFHMEGVGCLAVEGGSEEAAGLLACGGGVGSLAVSEASSEAVRQRGNQWVSGIGEWCKVLIKVGGVSRTRMSSTRRRPGPTSSPWARRATPGPTSSTTRCRAPLATLPPFLSLSARNPRGGGSAATSTTLEATQGQFDGFFSQLPYTYHQNRVAYVGD